MKNERKKKKIVYLYSKLLFTKYKTKAKQKHHMPDFVLLILNCEKYRYKAKKQKETWIPKFTSTFPDIPYYHVLGSLHLETDFSFNNEEHTLCVHAGDDYNSLSRKVLHAFQAVVHAFPDVKYILKTDDDQIATDISIFQFLSTSLLRKWNNSTQRIHYGGCLMHVRRPYVCRNYQVHPELPTNLMIKATTYCSGRFYFISKEAVLELEQHYAEIYKEYVEYYAIGYYLPERMKKTALYIDVDHYFQDDPVYAEAAATAIVAADGNSRSVKMSLLPQASVSSPPHSSSGGNTQNDQDSTARSYRLSLCDPGYIGSESGTGTINAVPNANLIIKPTNIQSKYKPIAESNSSTSPLPSSPSHQQSKRNCTGSCSSAFSTIMYTFISSLFS